LVPATITLILTIITTPDTALIVLAIIALVRAPIVLALLLLLWLRSEDLRRDLAQHVIDALRLGWSGAEANR
jgi:hypothetical protein